MRYRPERGAVYCLHARASEVTRRRRRYHGVIEWLILGGSLLSVRLLKDAKSVYRACYTARRVIMRNYRLTVLISVVWLVGGAATVPRLAADNCRSVDATLLLHMAPDGCTSPVKVCTQGTVVSSEPSLTGATWFFRMQGNAPSIGLPEAIEPASTLSYAGGVVVTTPHDGTFSTTNIGVYDTALGAFSQLDRIVDGTGRFAHAKGHLFVAGTGNAEAGFQSTVRGEVCLK
jgi:hypothetical protein